MRSSVLTRPLPRGQLRAGQLADHRRQRPHLLAVERLLEQPPLAQMLLPVDDEDRVRPGERAQELPALAGGGDRRGQREDLAHRVGSAEQDHRLLGPVRADRGRVAEARVHARQERRRAGSSRPASATGRARAGPEVCEPLGAVARSYVL